jgi:sugar transferase (PEP-CTERM/EpsH1 system associated)
MGKPPLIAHIIYHLGVGGLENGLVNLINNIPPHCYHHAIICVKGYSDFHKRINRDDVEIIALNKSDGIDLGLYFNLYKTLRRLKPDLVHTRNLSAMEGQIIATLSGVRSKVHGEHGRDIFDIDGKNRKYNLLRKAICPFIDHFITVSKDLEYWLHKTVGVSSERISQIYNGVDSFKFQPCSTQTSEIGSKHFFTEHSFVIGSVGRMVAVKDFQNLVRAFLLVLKKIPDARDNLRLLIVGDGAARKECLDLLQQAGAEDLAWLPGERKDIAELMCAMDLFVLPSLGEGISNTILEAMSTGLPVIATKVGGNVELVHEGHTGNLIEPGQPEALAEAIITYYENPILIERYGHAAREKILADFSMEAMMASYLSVYDRVLQR